MFFACYPTRTITCTRQSSHSRPRAEEGAHGLPMNSDPTRSSPGRRGASRATGHYGAALSSGGKGFGFSPQGYLLSSDEEVNPRINTPSPHTSYRRRRASAGGVGDRGLRSHGVDTHGGRPPYAYSMERIPRDYPYPPERERVGYTFYDEEEPWAHLYAEAAILSDRRNNLAAEGARLRGEHDDREWDAAAMGSVHKGRTATPATFNRLASSQPRLPTPSTATCLPSPRRSSPSNAPPFLAGGVVGSPSSRDRLMKGSPQRGRDATPANNKGESDWEGGHVPMQMDCGGNGRDGVNRVPTGGAPLFGRDSSTEDGQGCPSYAELCGPPEPVRLRGSLSDLPRQVIGSDPVIRSEMPVRAGADRDLVSGSEADSTLELTCEVTALSPDERNVAGYGRVAAAVGASSSSSRAPSALRGQTGALSDGERYSTPHRLGSVGRDGSPVKKRVGTIPVKRNKTPRKASPSPSSPTRLRRHRPVQEEGLGASMSSGGMLSSPAPEVSSMPSSTPMGSVGASEAAV